MGHGLRARSEADSRYADPQKSASPLGMDMLKATRKTMKHGTADMGRQKDTQQMATQQPTPADATSNPG